MEISAAVSEKIATLLTTNGILSQDRLTKITIQCAQNKEKIIPELLKKDFINPGITFGGVILVIN